MDPSKIQNPLKKCMRHKIPVPLKNRCLVTGISFLKGEAIKYSAL